MTTGTLFEGIGHGDTIIGLNAAKETMSPKNALTASMTHAALQPMLAIYDARGAGQLKAYEIHEAIVAAAVSLADSLCMTILTSAIGAKKLTFDDAAEMLDRHGRMLADAVAETRPMAAKAFRPLAEQSLAHPNGGAN